MDIGGVIYQLVCESVNTMKKLLIISLVLLLMLGSCSYVPHREFTESELDRIMDVSQRICR